MSPLGNELAYAFCAELVTEQSSTGDAPPMHQLQSDLSKGAGSKTLRINAGLLSHAYIINLISVTCTIYGKQMRDFTCC